MNYPLISEYIEAIKSAEDNFVELTNLRPVLGDDGQPVMTSGNFAVVFKMEDTETGKFYALKCFTKEQEGRAEAYHQIADALKDVDSPYLVSLRYLDKELFVDTEQTSETEFPVLLMDWVEGKTLDKYLRENLDDKYALEMLAYRFSQLAQWLIPQPFAHGDLKPDNILVREDESLVLVDYDGMYVPAMKGQKARELGSPDYRHPQRTEAVFDEHIDDFSLIIIMLSLACISLSPDSFVDSNHFDGTIFHESDFKYLSNSVSFKHVLELIIHKEVNCLYAVLIILLSEKRIDYKTYTLLFGGDQEKMYNNFKIYSKWDNKSKFCLSCCLRNGIGCDKDAKMSTEMLRQMAEFDNDEAQLYLGYSFFHGLGVLKNYEKAFNWYMRSANLGNAKSLCYLGACYSKGVGVPQSDEIAVECFIKAAEKGNAIAMNNIGSCYLYGKGVPQSYEKAIEWFSKAIENGSVRALCNKGICYLLGHGVEKDYGKGIECFLKAADQGSEMGEQVLGICYYTGIGVPQNYEKSVGYFIKAVKKGNPIAQLYLGICYFEGNGVMQNFEKAFVLYKKSAEQGNADAQCNLASCYLNGKGVSKSYNKAFEWYQKSAEQGYIKAQYNLGVCYENGIGVNLNINEAKTWYEKAAKKSFPSALKALERLSSND